jgi:hypothetical protein
MLEDIKLLVEKKTTRVTYKFQPSTLIPIPEFCADKNPAKKKWTEKERQEFVKEAGLDAIPNSQGVPWHSIGKFRLQPPAE